MRVPRQTVDEETWDWEGRPDARARPLKVCRRTRSGPGPMLERGTLDREFRQ